MIIREIYPTHLVDLKEKLIVEYNKQQYIALSYVWDGRSKIWEFDF